MRFVEKNNGECKTKIYLGGSYGQENIDVDGDKYKHFMFFAGGIGITPMRSLADSIYHDVKRGRKVESIDLHWSFRDLKLANYLKIMDDGLNRD